MVVRYPYWRIYLLQRIVIFLFSLILLSACSAPEAQVSLTPTVLYEAEVTETTLPPTATWTPVPPLADDTPTPQPSETSTGEPVGPVGLIAYVGSDGNLWLLERATGEVRPLTEDALAWQPGSQDQTQTITYCCVAWSSDGELLAYQREVGDAVESGMQYTFELWGYEPESDQARLLLENMQTAGFSWRPGTHWISFGLTTDPAYFVSRGETSAELAKGIWGVEYETVQVGELVTPTRGLSLVVPQWSADGSILAFDEVYLMEGRGKFAYYDFEAQEYVAWDEVIGGYSLSPDGEWIAFDTLAYTASGTERIWLRTRLGDLAETISPEDLGGYAFGPVFSPQGDRIAYLASLGGPDDPQNTLLVYDLTSRETLELGSFESVMWLSWSPDGERLLFSAGPYPDQQVMEVALADGSSSVLAQGSQADWQPVAP